MFSWFGKFWNGEKHEEQQPLDDVYSIDQRVIYTYWDGKKMVKADPMILFKNMMAMGADLFIEIKVSMSDSKDAAKAFDSSVDKIRKIFSVEPLSENGGLTEAETLNLFDHFLVYVDRLKKNSKTSQISPTATSAASRGSTAESPAMPSTWVSGSTGRETPSDVPM